jgi:hypothetical protein
VKPTLKAPDTKQFKLKHGKLLSNFAFKINLRRYTKVEETGRENLELAERMRSQQVGPCG